MGWILGATNQTLSIADLNASQHEELHRVGEQCVWLSHQFGRPDRCQWKLNHGWSVGEADETDGNIAYDSSGNGNDGN